MKICSNSNLTTLLLALVTLLLVTPTLAADENRNIYLIRHAEKQADGTKDPSLTEQGRSRAANIFKQLKGKNITVIYSTNYKRTRETASPLVAFLKIELTLYDSNQLKNFAEQLLAERGNALVIGHSNTTPQLVELLGGDPHGSIRESEYQRLYHLAINATGVKTTLLSSLPSDTQRKH